MAVAATAIFARCDSMDMIEVEPESESSSRIEAVRTYYETAIQPNGLSEQPGGKISGDSMRTAVLAEMIRQYPPDWSKAVTWKDGNEYRVATVIGADKPAVSFSDDKIAVVRTLVADLDEKENVTNAVLVEFASSDPLDAASFAGYVKQWYNKDYGDNKVLTAEYSLGYEGSQAYLYNPSDSVLKPATQSLKRLDKAGKTARDEIDICWYVYDKIGETCFRHPYDGTEACGPHYAWVLTCVTMDTGGGGGGGGGDDGGGGGDDGNGDGVGTGGGSDDKDSGTSFSLSCDSNVTRGSTGSCTVSVTSDDDNVTASDFTYEWSSGVGASESRSGGDGYVWSGLATETTKITVKVASENYAGSATTSVNARTGWGPAFNAEEEFSDVDLSVGGLGSYAVSEHPPPGVAIKEGSGPWAGHHMTHSIPQPYSLLKIHPDYDSSSVAPTYTGAHVINCAAAAVPFASTTAYSVYAVNAACKTTAGFFETLAAIRVHEREHESGYNKCISSSSAIAEIEAMTGGQELASRAATKLSTFYRDVIKPLDPYAGPHTGTNIFHFRSGSWTQGTMGVVGHGALVSCN